MNRYASLLFLIVLATFLIAEERYEYGKDEWENDYNIEEKGLFNVVEIQESVESQEENEESNKNVKSNYFTKMYIEGVFKWARNQSNHSIYTGKINSHIFANYYEAFLSFAPFSNNVLALRFSPVLMYYPKKFTSPVFSLYFGSFNTPQSFRNVYNPLISSITPTSNRKFSPPLSAMKISKKPSGEGIALEVSLPFFNYYSFWKNTKKGNIFNTYISYKNKFSNFSLFNVALISSIQEIKKENVKRSPYLQIYGLDFNFSNQFFYINSISLLTILPKRVPSFSSFAFRSESGLVSNFVSLHSGISYKGAYYLGNQNLETLLQEKTFLSFYLQGKLKYKIFRLNGVYHLLKDYKLGKIQHSYGIFYSLGTSFFSYKNELLYRKDVYKIKFALNITPSLNYFKLFNIFSFLYLQNRKINPRCIEKYEIASKCGFNFGKHFALNFSFAMMQEKKNWQKMVFFASSTVMLTFSQEKTKEKGEIKVRYNTKKQNFELSFKCRIEY